METNIDINQALRSSNEHLRASNVVLREHIKMVKDAEKLFIGLAAAGWIVVLGFIIWISIGGHQC